MNTAALAFGVASAASELEFSLDNARRAETKTDLSTALDKAEVALARIRGFVALALDQASEEADARSPKTTAPVGE